MKHVKGFMCILLVLFLLMPLSVAAAETDRDSYSALFKTGTHAQWKQAFLDDPLLFVSTLSEEEYGRMISVVTFTFEPEDVEKNGAQYKQTLLTLAQQNKLDQAERRVVRWLLDVLGAEYDMWTADIDYGELFSRCAEMDGALPAYYSEELEEVFGQDPYRFLQEMSESSADLDRLSWILMDHIYHCNSDRQETATLLQDMKRSEKLTDAQKQMLRKLWQAEGELIGEYGLPLDVEPATEPEESPTDATEPKVLAQTEPDEQKDWLLPCVGIGILLAAIIGFACLRRRKA